MNKTIGAIEDDLDIKEFREELQASSLRLRKKIKMVLTSAFIFAMCVLATFLLSSKEPLRAYGSPYGYIADVLSMITLVPTVMFSGFVWVEWSSSREMRKDLNELVEDRYGVHE